MNANKLSYLMSNEWLTDDSDTQFEEFVNAMPARHWARYDISATRLGWEAYKTLVHDEYKEAQL